MTKDELTASYRHFYGIMIANADLISPRCIDIGTTPGWISLIERIIAVVRARNETIQIVQIKEKFGSLRFYFDGGSSELREEIRKIEAEASKTCDVCGDVGSSGGDGWVVTRCPIHKSFKWPNVDWETYTELTTELRAAVSSRAVVFEDADFIYGGRVTTSTDEI